MFLDVRGGLQDEKRPQTAPGHQAQEQQLHDLVVQNNDSRSTKDGFKGVPRNSNLIYVILECVLCIPDGCFSYSCFYFQNVTIYIICLLLFCLILL